MHQYAGQELTTDARRSLRQSRQQTVAVNQDRDDLIGQRDTGRAYTASTLGIGTPSSDPLPGPAGSRPGRLRPFGRRAAPRHATETPEPPAGQAAADVPAGAVSAEQLTSGSQPGSGRHQPV
jgi:hypothetical protein